MLEDSTLNRKLLIPLTLILCVCVKSQAQEIYKFLPQSTQLLIYADVHRIANCNLTKEIIAKHLIPQFNFFIKRSQTLTGIDWRKDIDFIAIGASGDNTKQISGIIKGRFSSSSIADFLKNYPTARLHKYRQHTVYILDINKQKAYIRLIKNNLLVFAFDWLYLCHTLDAIEGDVPNAKNSELAGWARIPYNGGIYIALNNASQFLKYNKTLATTRRLTFSMPEPALNVSAKLTLYTYDQKKAQQLFEFSKVMAHIGIQKILAMTNNPNNPQVNPLGMIFKTLNVELEGKDLIAEFDCPATDILATLNQFKHRFASKQHAKRLQK